MFDALKAARKAEALGRKLTVVRTSCLGWCQYAPVVMVLPEGKVVQGLAPVESGPGFELILSTNGGCFGRMGKD